MFRWLKRFTASPIIEAEKSPSRCICGNSESCHQKYRASLAAKFLITGHCPDCGEPLYEGPKGGASVNVRCNNGHKFNMGQIFDSIIMERIS